MKNISIILIVIFAIFFASCKGNKNKSNVDDRDTIVYPSYEEFNNENDKTLLDSTEVETTETEVVYTEDTEGNLTPQTEESEGEKYYVIVGSFKVYNNALKLQNHFQSMGYEVNILPKTNDYNRVSVGAFDKKSDAKVKVTSLRTKHNDASFWILYK